MASEQLDLIIAMLTSRPVGAETTIHEMRAGLEAMVANVPRPEDTTCEPIVAAGVPCEWIVGRGAGAHGTLFYLHGGGYVMGSLNTHRGVVGNISAASGLRGLAVDYRLGPEHPFPAAVDDATAVYRWLLARGTAPETIVIAGDSAGGGLTMATLVALRDAGDPLPAAGVCLSPWVDLACSGESMHTKAAVDPMVQRDRLLRMAEAYLGGGDARAPLASPLYADLRGLPPLLVQVGTRETLLDDSTRLASRARAAGVDVVLEPWDDMIHVWQAFAPLLPEADRAVARIGEWVRGRVRRG
jgi:acetyl esterase/lipase